MPGRKRTIIGELEQQRYRHKSRGPRFHDFGPGVKLVGGTSGQRTVTVSPDLWTPDGPWLVNRGDRRQRLVAQSVLFARPGWSESRARTWLKAHGYRAGAVDRTRHELRFRQVAPRTIARGSYRTLRFGRGVEAVMGHARNPAGLAIFTNPGKRKGHAMARRHHKRPVPAGFSSWRAYMAHIREGGKVKRHRSRKRNPESKSLRRAAARLGWRRKKVGRRRNDPSRRARYGVRHTVYRRNPGGVRGFLRELMPAYLTSLGVTGGKAVARGLIPFVTKKQPTGLVGLGAQTLVGGLAAFGVHLMWPKIGLDMLVGTFENLNESLLRTPITIGGVARPIPFFGTALSDYREAYRLSGYSMRPNLNAYRERQIAAPGTVRARAPVSSGRRLAAI